MGIWKIDQSYDRMTPDEWNRMMMRRHTIQRWLITLAEIAFMALVVWGMILLFGEVQQ